MKSYDAIERNEVDLYLLAWKDFHNVVLTEEKTICGLAILHTQGLKEPHRASVCPKFERLKL